LVQLHRKFTDEQVKELIEKYLRKEVGRRYLQEILGINKTRFFALVKAYRANPYSQSSMYGKAKPERSQKQLKLIYLRSYLLKRN
jgi:hypothetical protein